MNVYACADEPAPPLPDECSAWVVIGYEPSPFALDIEAATQITGAILLCWATAWVFKTIARHLRDL